MIESMQRRNVEVERLSVYFHAQPDGEEVSWLRVEHETSVVMDAKGRGLARRALARAKRPYVALRNVGVRLSAPETAMEIMGWRFVRIDRAVRKADRTRTILSGRHMEQMPEEGKQRFLALAAFFGAVRVIASEAKARLLGSQPPPVPTLRGGDA